MPDLINIYFYQFAAYMADLNKIKSLVYKELDHSVSSRTLDVCCGTGNFADLASGEYLGVDLSKENVLYAGKRFGGNKLKKFAVSDIGDIACMPKYFHNILFLGALHHLGDEAASNILNKINKTAKGAIIITDPAVETKNPVSRLLISLDKGKFVRPVKKQLELVSSNLDIVRHFTFASGLAHIRMIICRPK